MAVLVLIAPLLGRRYNLLRALVVAGCAMIFINPYILLFDVGFQLSFLATLGLILVAPQFELILMRAPNTLKIREFFIATLATQVAVAPLLLYQIGELSLIALLVNVLVLPMVGVAMLLTFATGMLAFVSINLASVVAVPTHLSLLYIIECARWFSEIPFASVTAPPFPIWLMIGAYLLMGCSWYFVTNKNKYKSKNNESVTKPNAPENIKIQEWTVVLEEDVIQESKQKTSRSENQGTITDLPTDQKIQKKEEVPIFFR